MQIPFGHRSHLRVHETSFLSPAVPFLRPAEYNQFLKRPEETEMQQCSGSDLSYAPGAWATGVAYDSASRLHFAVLHKLSEQKKYRILEKEVADALPLTCIGLEKHAQLHTRKD